MVRTKRMIISINEPSPILSTLTYHERHSPTHDSAEYYRRNAPSEEDFKEILETKYGQQIETARASRAGFQDFMNEMKNDSKELDKKMNTVLYGGKDSAKRVYAVDDTLYGQSDGLKLKKQSLENIRQEKIRRAKENRDKGDIKTETESLPLSNPQIKSMVAFAAVGTLAAAIGFLLGGNKRQ